MCFNLTVKVEYTSLRYYTHEHAILDMLLSDYLSFKHLYYFFFWGGGGWRKIYFAPPPPPPGASYPRYATAIVF